MPKLTLGFNEQDFAQHEAYNILKGKGRKISKYVAELVLNDQENRDIKKLIKETISEEFANITPTLEAAAASSKTKEKPEKESKKSKKKAEDVPDSFYGSDDDIVDSLLSSFPGMGE